MGEFRRQLTYKSQWKGKHLVVIDRFFPSSRLCRGCGAVNGELTLSDRHWVCRCGRRHDRDGSAAINIRDEGLRILAEGHSDKRNARGAGVRPAGEGGRRKVQGEGRGEATAGSRRRTGNPPPSGTACGVKPKPGERLPKGV